MSRMSSNIAHHMSVRFFVLFLQHLAVQLINLENIILLDVMMINDKYYMHIKYCLSGVD